MSTTRASAACHTRHPTSPPIIGLGEDLAEASEAVTLAGYTAADARTYAVRIYPPRR
ncbi:hypothetical protein LQ384_23230 [Rhodococcus rhodochrous]|uniref:Uncharacterized protein n=1 Tax=Rhodococcus rhodochrous TaxID=1829 RepID=A0AAW4XNP8_RHORH|nr:hypothetical protein [Rhodococcus rhodochrous]